MDGTRYSLDLMGAQLAILDAKLFKLWLFVEPLVEHGNYLGILDQIFHVVEIENCQSMQLLVEISSVEKLLKHFNR